MEYDKNYRAIKDFKLKKYPAKGAVELQIAVIDQRSLLFSTEFIVRSRLVGSDLSTIIRYRYFHRNEPSTVEFGPIGEFHFRSLRSAFWPIDIVQSFPNLSI